MIRLGCCADVPKDKEGERKIKSIIDAGFEYLELGLFPIVLMEDSKRAAALDFMKSNPIKSEVMNLFVPTDLKLVGNEADFDTIRRYFEKAFPIAKEFGAEILVFGSGNSRTVPQGYSHDMARSQLFSFLRLANGYGEDFDIEIAIEPLNSRESNIINSLTEAYWFSKHINRSKIKLLADFYHMQSDHEPLETLFKFKGMLAHTHMASKRGRWYPVYQDRWEYETCFDILREIDYDGRMSIEGFTNDFENDIVESYRLLDELRR